MLRAPRPDGRAVRRYAAPLLILALLAGMPGAVPASAETTAAPEPATVAVEARALPTGPEALIGTIGFRGTSDNPAFVGRYVTTGISPVVDSEGMVVDLRHDRKVKARDNANPVIFELGLFRDAGVRFKLLGENGLWVALKTPAAFPDGIFMAAVGKWRAAWGFKAVRPIAIDPVAEDKLAESGIDLGLPICLEAYQGASYRGLATLDLQGYLVLDPDGVCGADVLALFITDDLPLGGDVADLRKDPATPVDPDHQGALRAPGPAGADADLNRAGRRR